MKYKGTGVAGHDLYRDGNDKERKEEWLSKIGMVQGTKGHDFTCLLRRKCEFFLLSHCSTKYTSSLQKRRVCSLNKRQGVGHENERLQLISKWSKTNAGTEKNRVIGNTVRKAKLNAIFTSAFQTRVTIRHMPLVLVRMLVNNRNIKFISFTSQDYKSVTSVLSDSTREITS